MNRNPKLRYPHDATYTWKATWLFGWIVYPLLLQYVISGENNIPTKGAAIVACNHNYGADFVLLGISSPRQIHFMTKAEAYRMSPLLNRYLYGLGTFPVERDKRDISAIRNAVRVLRAGRLLGMFPEGTRSKTGQLQEAKSGTARIAIAASVPVIPTAVVGSQQLFKGFWKPSARPKVHIRYGEPITWSSTESDEASSVDFTRQIMHEIARLLPAEMRGVYQDNTLG